MTALCSAVHRTGRFPPGRPYRSIGVEPMLGQVSDLAEAGLDDAVAVPATGAVSWRLIMVALP